MSDFDELELPEQSRRYFCEEHSLFKFQDLMGNIVCPFCEIGLSSDKLEELKEE